MNLKLILCQEDPINSFARIYRPLLKVGILIFKRERKTKEIKLVEISEIEETKFCTLDIYLEPKETYFILPFTCSPKLTPSPEIYTNPISRLIVNNGLSLKFQDTLKEIFDRFSADGYQSLSFKQFSSILAKIDIEMTERQYNETIINNYDHIDSDLSFKGFCQFWFNLVKYTSEVFFF